MIKKLRNELLYLFGIIVVLAFVWHPDLFTSPLERVERMSMVGNYFHPFLFGLGVYLFVGFFRTVYALIHYLKNKGSKN